MRNISALFSSAVIILSGFCASSAGATGAYPTPSESVLIRDARDAPVPMVLAQAPAAAPPAAAQPAQVPADPFIRNAVAVTQALDAGGAGQIYDAASAAMKRAVSRDDFAKAVAATNARVGRVVSREWGRVERLRVDAPAAGAAPAAVPPGNYVTVFVVARSAGGAPNVEQVSFRLDEDNQWRLVGVNWSASATGGAAAAPAQPRK